MWATRWITTAGTNATAPRIVEYGYDQAWTQMEGLANRIINVVDYGGNDEWLDDAAKQLHERPQSGRAKRVALAAGWINSFIWNASTTPPSWSIVRSTSSTITKASNPNKPFFMNVWLDETHTPHDPPAALRTKYNSLYPSLPSETRNYLAVLEHADQQIGRLINHIDQQGLGDDTLILVTADNGAVGVNANNINSTGPFRGTKGHLFEGGMRQPLIARWTGNVAANRTDSNTVIWAPDLFPTLTQIAGIAAPAGVTFDGENMSEALLGHQSQARSSSLFWNMNRGTSAAHSNPNSAGAGANGQEVLAIRNGNWKLLINAQGTAPELYDVPADVGETINRAQQNLEVMNLLSQQALSIRYSTPSRTLPDAVTPLVRLKAQDLATLGNGAAVASWSDTATGNSFNGNVSQSTAANRPTRCRRTH